MRALFITLDKCPNIDAGAVRTHMIAKMLIENQYDVTVVSMGPYNNGKIDIVDGIKYISFRPQNESFISKAAAYIVFHLKLKRFLHGKNFDVLFHTQVDERTFKVIKKYGQKYHAKLIYDAVEWFSPEQFKNGTASHTYKLNNNYNTRYITGEHKVISISSYLHNNFRNQGIDSLLMPVVLDVRNISYDKNVGNRINIIYAGVPGKKDYLDAMIKALGLLKEEERNQLSLKIIGCSREQFITNTTLKTNEIAQVEENIVFLGRLSRKAVLTEYAAADFSVLIRSQRARYAQAGFPTKVVESLSTATPVICNYTSDIKRYIKHLENGVIVDGEDECACMDALRCVIALDRNFILRMQKNARQTAENFFDYRIYADKMINFIKG